MQLADPHNPLLQLAHDFVFHTNQSVFLTGKAGTGKTTFLKQLKNNCPKQMAVLAPTGVAAINAGGTTIHSFFQLPFAPFIPGNVSADNDAVASKQSLISKLRFNREKRELLQSLDLLVIDEISMVRCDVLDAIDTILRHFRNNPTPFGGLQMLFIGDMYQLPPVVQDQEWQLLQDYYNGPFFFNSQVVKEQPPVYIELQTIYRQSDQRFIDLLNEVRNNKLTQDGLTLLNSRFNPGFVPPPHSNYITLTTHNKKADTINESELSALHGKVWSYKAAVDGDFNERSFPAEETLQLKVGAQVMFLKNDVQGRKYYNGKIGIVTSLDDDEIKVQCEGDDWPIEVKQDVWRNVQYTLNKQAQQVEEKELGSFTQFPLRLAWAVTIHKSQGLTFEHAIIDAAGSFSAGQVYVALSRCKSLEGMVLLTRVPQSAVMVDKRVQQYAAGGKQMDELQRFFATSKMQFQQQMLMQIFDAEKLLSAANGIQKTIQDHADSFGEMAMPWAIYFVQQVTELKGTSTRFQQQLRQHFTTNTQLPEADNWVQERAKKAAVWFAEKLETDIIPAIKKQPAVSDSKEHADELDVALAKAFTAAKQWQQLVAVCRNGFDAIELLKAKSKVNIAEVIGLAYAGSSKRKQQLDDSPHPILLSQLKKMRDSICEQNGRPIYMVAATSTLHELALYLPQTPKELLQINGFGEQKVQQFGEAFLSVIKQYCDDHHLDSHIGAKEPKRQRKKKAHADEDDMPKQNTRQITYEWWKLGKTVAEIAAERRLQPATIESHLVGYILNGLVPRQVLITDEVFEKAAAIIKDLQTTSMGPVKEIMGDEISFGQIRLVMQWLINSGEFVPPQGNSTNTEDV